jgi:hypothetical protein
MRYMSPGAVGLTFASMLSGLSRTKVAFPIVPDDRNLLLFSLPDKRARQAVARCDCGAREPQSNLTGSLLV